MNMLRAKFVVVYLLILNLGQAKGINEDGGMNIVFAGEVPTKINYMTNATTVYIRWGRDDCNTGISEIVYSGLVGGGSFEHTGSGTNRLCLPQKPKYDESLVVKGVHSYNAFVYGAEFSTKYFAPWKHLHDGYVLCAVCLARGRSTTQMFPAETTCPPGWTKEYGGLLMAAKNSHAAASEYVCVDDTSKVPPGSTKGNLNGAMLFPAEGICGSLPCPPYVEGNELACVVCSI